jgi:hypothetical protein
LSAAGNPPQQAFVNLSSKQFNTVHSNTFHFYEEINEVIQHKMLTVNGKDKNIFAQVESPGSVDQLGLVKSNHDLYGRQNG